MFRANLSFRLCQKQFRESVYVSTKALSIAEKNFPKSESLSSEEKSEMDAARIKVQEALKTLQSFKEKYPVEENALLEFEKIMGRKEVPSSSSFAVGYTASKLESAATTEALDALSSLEPILKLISTFFGGED